MVRKHVFQKYHCDHVKVLKISSMKGNSEKENEHSIHICPHFISLLRVEKAKKITVL